MRRVLLLGIVAAAAYGWHSRPDQMRAWYREGCLRISGAFAALSGAPTPAQPEVSAPVAAERRVELAEGFYCLTKSSWFNTGGRQVVRPAGTVVRKLGEGGSGKVLVSDETGRGVVDATALTRDPQVIEAVSALNSELERAARPVVAAATPVSATDGSALAARDISRHEERPTVYGRTGQESEDWASYLPSNNSRIQAIDAQIATLQGELVKTQQATDRALEKGYIPRPAGHAAKLQQQIWELEREKNRLSRP